MAVTPTLMRDHQFNGEHDAVGVTVHQRAYDIGAHATLAAVNLEIGDGLPEDATIEITDSWIETKGNKRIAHVVASEFKYE